MGGVIAWGSPPSPALPAAEPPPSALSAAAVLSSAAQQLPVGSFCNAAPGGGLVRRRRGRKASAEARLPGPCISDGPPPPALPSFVPPCNAFPCSSHPQTCGAHMVYCCPLPPSESLATSVPSDWRAAYWAASPSPPQAPPQASPTPPGLPSSSVSPDPSAVPAASPAPPAKGKPAGRPPSPAATPASSQQLQQPSGPGSSPGPGVAALEEPGAVPQGPSGSSSRVPAIAGASAAAAALLLALAAALLWRRRRPRARRALFGSEPQGRHWRGANGWAARRLGWRLWDCGGGGVDRRLSALVSLLRGGPPEPGGACASSEPPSPFTHTWGEAGEAGGGRGGERRGAGEPLLRSAGRGGGTLAASGLWRGAGPLAGAAVSGSEGAAGAGGCEGLRRTRLLG